MAQETIAKPNYHTVLNGITLVEPTPRWIRVNFNGETIADSKHALYVLEPKHLGDYYFPKQDVRLDLLTQTQNTSTSPTLGTATYWDLKVRDAIREGAAWTYTAPQDGYPDLADYIAFKWNKVDQWFEEDEEVFVHARNPYHRVDVARSTRHVQIIVNGQTVADTHQPVLLWETSLPTRYYIVPDDVRLDLLEPNDSSTRCPYKGIASYWSFRSGGSFIKDIAWSYQHPINELPEIKGLISFFNERVEAIYVDGELQPVPQNQWSTR